MPNGRQSSGLCPARYRPHMAPMSCLLTMPFSLLAIECGQPACHLAPRRAGPDLLRWGHSTVTVTGLVTSRWATVAAHGLLELVLDLIPPDGG